MRYILGRQLRSFTRYTILRRYHAGLHKHTDLSSIFKKLDESQAGFYWLPCMLQRGDNIFTVELFIQFNFSSKVNNLSRQ